MLGTAKRGSVCFGNQKNSVGWSHFSHNLNMLVMLTTSSMIRLWCMCFVASTLRGSVYFGSETKFIISHFSPPSTFSQSLIMLLTLTTSSTISLWCIYLRGSVYFGHQHKIRIKCFFFPPPSAFFQTLIMLVEALGIVCIWNCHACMTLRHLHQQSAVFAMWHILWTSLI